MKKAKNPYDDLLTHQIEDADALERLGAVDVDLCCCGVGIELQHIVVDILDSDIGHNDNVGGVFAFGGIVSASERNLGVALDIVERQGLAGRTVAPAIAYFLIAVGNKRCIGTGGHTEVARDVDLGSAVDSKVQNDKTVAAIRGFEAGDGVNLAIVVYAIVAVEVEGIAVATFVDNGVGAVLVDDKIQGHRAVVAFLNRAGME